MTFFQMSFLVKSFIRMVIPEYPAQIYKILYEELSKQQNHSFDNSRKNDNWNNVVSRFLYYLKEAVKIDFCMD